MALLRIVALGFLASTVTGTDPVATKEMIFHQEVDFENVTAAYCEPAFYNQVKQAVSAAASLVATNNTFESDEVVYLKIGDCAAWPATTGRRLLAKKLSIDSRIKMPATDADQLAKCDDAMKAAFLNKFKQVLTSAGVALGVDKVDCPRIAGRMRNIGLGIAGAAIGATIIGVGVGCGLRGCLKDEAPTQAPVPVATMAPVPVLPTAAPVAPIPTAAVPEDEGSMPTWAIVLLALALLCAIAAAVFMLMRGKKEKKKRAVEKRGIEPVRIVEEVQPLVAPPMTFVQAPMTYAAPMTYQPQYQQTYQVAPPQPAYQVVEQAPTYGAPRYY